MSAGFASKVSPFAFFHSSDLAARGWHEAEKSGGESDAGYQAG